MTTHKKVYTYKVKFSLWPFMDRKSCLISLGKTRKGWEEWSWKGLDSFLYKIKFLWFRLCLFVSCVISNPDFRFDYHVYTKLTRKEEDLYINVEVAYIRVTPWTLIRFKSIRTEHRVGVLLKYICYTRCYTLYKRSLCRLLYNYSNNMFLEFIWRFILRSRFLIYPFIIPTL